MAKAVITARQAAELVQNSDTLAVSGFVGFSIPDTLMQAVRDRFLETGAPENLTLFHIGACGDGKNRGANRLALEKLLKRLVCGHIGLEPEMNKLTAAEKIETYTLPQGVNAHLARAIAGKKPGVVTHVGLQTFVDPRLEGGKANQKARDAEDLVQLIEVNGEEQLLFRSFPLNVAFIRASLADEDGNLSLRKECVISDQYELAAATRNSGGIVIAEVDRIVKQGALSPHEVRVHGSMVDYLVENDKALSVQSYLSDDYHPEWCGEYRVPASVAGRLPLSERKVIARRAAMEARAGMLINLGIGMPDGVASVAAEEGFIDRITLTIESGAMGGVPLPGVGIGGSMNAEAFYKHADMFDFYDGGGIDLSCLGAAQIDAKGNVNVSKFSGRTVGPGGFINISQNAKKMCFAGSFTAGKSEIDIRDGALRIVKDGGGVKFLPQVEQVTFSGERAKKSGREILYITERAVFRITDAGLTLCEIAPGVDLERDIFARMGFAPAISPDLKQMDARLFHEGPMGLSL